MRALCRAISAVATHTHHHHRMVPSLQGTTSFVSITGTASTTTPRRLYSQKAQPHQEPPRHQEQDQQKRQQPHHHHQHQQTPSYYTFFPRSLPHGPPPHGPFQLDPRALRSEYLALQAKHHPDKQQHQPPTPSDPDPQLLSSTINQAYRTLLDPLLRAEYLLSQHGCSPSNDESATLDGQDGVDEARLLSLVMDAHEQVEDARSAEDLHELTLQNDERIAESERVLGRAFAEEDWETARREAVRLKYWVNIRQAVREGKWEGGHDV
ncbi:hypothetical protein E4U55_001111 [Claviceps digitariae]|nr:hypothetical protein E4U55_001111 [Claviceps digitariae]